MLADINIKELESVKKEVEIYTKNVLIFQCDVSDEKGVYSVVKEAESVFDKIDIFMRRTGTDMENANLVCFLASDDASYISGQNIQIDGCRKKQ